MFKTPEFEGSDRESGPRPFLTMFSRSDFAFFVERNLMDNCHVLWNKFQDYQLRLILTNHFLVTA